MSLVSFDGRYRAGAELGQRFILPGRHRGDDQRCGVDELDGVTQDVATVHGFSLGDTCQQSIAGRSG
jgi:hypothetical protein